MHETDFAKSAAPERVVVLNLLLQPYSLGHEILLHKHGNPLVLYRPGSYNELPEMVRRKALVGAVLICSRNWAGNQKREKWLRLWLWMIRKRDFDLATADFQAYHNDGTMDFPTMPQPRANDTPFHYFGAPEIARLILFVTEFYKAMGFASPYDFPLGLARQLYLTQLENTGAVWIQNAQDSAREEARTKSEAEGLNSKLSVGDDAVRESAEKWNKEHPECKVNL